MGRICGSVSRLGWVSDCVGKNVEEVGRGNYAVLHGFPWV